jgi:predicted DNA binding CopG/RHH family protein
LQDTRYDERSIIARRFADEHKEKDAMERRLSIRLRDENIDRLKDRATKSGAKNLSVYARQILESPPQTDRDLIKEIERLNDLTIGTRRAIGSLTGNINQIATFYNTRESGNDLSRL